jgi:hypothetical protein
MEEKEDAAAHPFWALGGAGDCRCGGNGGRMELSGWPNPVKRNRRMATMLGKWEHVRTQAGGAGRCAKQDPRAGKPLPACQIGALASHAGSPLMPSYKTGKAIALFWISK